MKRNEFIKITGTLAAGALLPANYLFSENLAEDFPTVRTALALRKFSSEAVEKAIASFKQKVGNNELAWLFENCFPNTLDTTVDFEMMDGRPDTYVITGDIDAMWMRDSSAQVWPYLQFIKTDKHLQQMVEGVINRQVKNILLDPYANAFYKDVNKVSEWKSDLTEMKPGVHERKWEIDSLCYPIRLAYHYWKFTGDEKPFDAQWLQAIQLILKTFKQQQRKENDGPYSFQRRTAWATDGVPMNGFGYPVKPVGLICSSFRPSDDATVFTFLIPSNFFAVVSLRQAAEMVKAIRKDNATASQLLALATEVEKALQEHAVVTHKKFGPVYAFEVNGMGSYNLMDDANIPSLLSMPYLGSVKNTDSTYINTRRFVLSDSNPFYFKGKAAEGIGGPHVGKDMVWPMSIIMRGLTSTGDEELKNCISTLQRSHGGTGFMHESFHKDDSKNFTRKWFAWANTLFGELLWKTFNERPHMLMNN